MTKRRGAPAAVGRRVLILRFISHGPSRLKPDSKCPDRLNAELRAKTPSTLRVHQFRQRHDFDDLRQLMAFFTGIEVAQFVELEISQRDARPGAGNFENSASAVSSLSIQGLERCQGRFRAVQRSRAQRKPTSLVAVSAAASFRVETRNSRMGGAPGRGEGP